MSKKLYLKIKLKYPHLNADSLEKVYLFEKLIMGKITASETVRLSFLRGMITQVQYMDYLRMEREDAET
ncbi:MAG: hypothetical protein JSR85_08285 [Proteobacteria bacterium]|nr:hypothetical protein [Pseudomonadota bacterium]